MKKLIKRIIVLVIFTIMSFCLCACNYTKISDDIEEYGMFYSIQQIYHTDTLLFPESLEEVQYINDYKFLYDTIAFGGHQIFLDVTYSEENYTEVVEYWQNYIYDSGNEVDLGLQFDEAGLFNYPTYIAIYGTTRYHYFSLIEDEKRIIYVSILIGSDIIFPEEFLPKDYYDSLGKYESDRYDYHIGSPNG